MSRCNSCVSSTLLGLGWCLILIVLGVLTSLSAAQRNFALQDDYGDYDGEPAGHENAVPRVHRPIPLQPPPPPKDPSVIFVPRMGLVRGNIGYKTIRNRVMTAFLGLKYGAVGSGLARFQRAARVENMSNDVIDATQVPANCPQFPDLDKIIAAESQRINVDDCLTLNVYTPNTDASYPVMVFIHGEMLFDGSAEEGQPDYFMEQDVVLVSVNYRLAPFGFLTTLTEDMPGNVALADIQLALEWIQQYIRPFGGNPEQVTLFGQAGGATLVHALSLSGQAQGLFHKLILQSGTALNPYFLEEDPSGFARSFARYAGCPTNGRDIATLNSCFARLSTTQLLNAFKTHWEASESRGLRIAGGFKLAIGDRLGYLPVHPAGLVANNAYPLIAGVTKDAGAFIMSRFYKDLAAVRSRNISDFINVVLKHTTQPRHYMVWRNLALHQIFTEEERRNPTLQNVAQGLLELTNLILYRAPILDSIRYTYRKHPTYLYCFDYRGEFHRFGHLSNPLPFEADATLSDDNIYLFPYPEDVSQLNPQDKTIARAIVTMWVNFAQSNVPNNNTGVWPNVSNEVGPFLRFSNTKEAILELDYHFGEGIATPNIYPEYFTTTTSTSTTTSTTTTHRPYPNYPYVDFQPQPLRPAPYYRAHEHVLNEPSQQRYPPSYPSAYSQSNPDVNVNARYASYGDGH